MYCPNCGNEIVDGMSFCPNCGAAVNAQQSVGEDNGAYAQTNAYAPAQPYQNSQQPQYVSGEKRNACAIIELVLGIVGAVLSWIAFFITLSVTLNGSSSSSQLEALMVVVAAIRWMGFACLIIGTTLGIQNVVSAKQRGSFGMSVSGLVVSAVSIIFWIFF